MTTVLRTICLFSRTIEPGVENRLRKLAQLARNHHLVIQTTRICCPGVPPPVLEEAVEDPAVLLSIGTVPWDHLGNVLPAFLCTQRVSFNLDLTSTPISRRHVDVLYHIIRENPAGTFRFTYAFNVPPSSPYFPSASYARDGFSVGLQPTNLVEGCRSLDEWLVRMREAWLHVADLFGTQPDFLGIDSSIAPLYKGESSLVHLLSRVGLEFESSLTSDAYLRMTSFVEKRNPHPVGLCGLMLPCLEDFELAEQYERGAFSVERNLFVSLQSGLGIDTYPIGVDEEPERVLQILRLVQGLSAKYHKPLSVRLVSDGKTGIGGRTDFRNQYLKDVTIRAL